MAVKYANNPVDPNRLKGKSMAKAKRKPAKRKHSRRPNGAATDARTTNGGRAKKRTGAHRYSTKARHSAKRTHNRVTKRKSTRGRRRYNGSRIGNPLSAGGVMKFAIAAGTAGAINAVINTIMNMLNLQLPQQGIVGLGAKLAVAYGIGALLPKTKIISQDTANVVAITIAAAAFTNWLTPMLDGLLAGFMPAAAPAAGTGANDVQLFDGMGWPYRAGPYGPMNGIGTGTPRGAMQDVQSIPGDQWPNTAGPYGPAAF